MSKFKLETQEIENLLNTLKGKHGFGPLTTWIKRMQTKPIKTYVELMDATNEFKEIQRLVTPKRFKNLNVSVNEVNVILNMVWRNAKKEFFEHYYVTEILKDKSHPLNNLLKVLNNGIYSFEEYEKMELRWIREAIPFCVTSASEHANAMKVSLNQFYHRFCQDYAKTVVVEEINNNPKHPLFELNKTVEDDVKLSKMNALDFEVLIRKTERALVQLSDQHRRILMPYFKKLFMKLKEKQYPISADTVHRRWKVCVQDIKEHPEWVLTNKLLKEFEKKLEHFTVETIEVFAKKLEETKEERATEMNQVEFEWIENEWEKHIRLWQKRLIDEANNEFGKWLSTTRQEKGLSLHELSALTQISVSYLHKLEKHGRKSPSITTIRRIVTALEIPFNDVAELLHIQVEEPTIVQQEPKQADLLLSLTEDNCVIGTKRLNLESRKSLAELLTLIYSKKFNPNTLQDSLKVIDLVKNAIC